LGEKIFVFVAIQLTFGQRIPPSTDTTTDALAEFPLSTFHTPLHCWPYVQLA